MKISLFHSAAPTSPIASVTLALIATASISKAGVVVANPSASMVSADSIFDSGGAESVVVVDWYSGQAGYDVYAESIDVTDISITGPGGPLTVTGVSLSPNADAENIQAIYTFNAPGGAWDPADNGSYTVDLEDEAIFNSQAGGLLNPSAAAAGAGTFTVAIQSSPILHWDLEEGSGSFTTEKISGFSSVAELIGSPTWITGIAPNSTQALDFTVTSPDSYIEAGTLQNDGLYVDSASAVDFRLLNSAWTVAAWINIPSGVSLSGDRCIMTTSTIDASNWWLFFVRNNSQKPNNLGFDFQSTRHYSGLDVPFDKSVLVVVTADVTGEGFAPGMRSRFMIWDGESWEAVETNRFSFLRMDRIDIGAFNDGEREFRGVIDSPMIFDTALNEEELTALALSSETGGDLGGIVSATKTLTNASTASFEVQFSEGVVGFDAADLNIVSDGTLVLGPAGVSGTTGGSQYTVTIPVTGDGDLTVDLITGSGVQTLDGNPLVVSSASPAVTVDQTAPGLLGITLIGSNPTGALEVSFEVEFTEPVAGYNSGTSHILNLVPDPNNTLAFTGRTVTGSGKDYTLTLNGTTGYGVFTIALSPLASISDLAGNSLVTSTISDSVTHFIDADAPTVLSITPDLSNPIAGSHVNFTVVFSEDVLLDTENDVLEFDSTNLMINWVYDPSPSGFNDTFVIEVRTEVVDGFDSGSTLVSVPLGMGIVDTAGNDLIGPVPSSSPVIFAAEPYQIWANGFGLTPGSNYDYDDDADNDGRLNGEEFLRNENPTILNESPRQRFHLVEVDGKTHGALTLAAPDDAEYDAQGSGEMYLSYCDAYKVCMYEEILPSLNLEDFADDAAHLMEDESIATPAGMPALDAGWSYRHFRFVQDVDAMPEAFLYVFTDED